MPTYLVPLVWEDHADIEVEADSPEDAFIKVAHMDNNELTENFVHDSFTVYPDRLDTIREICPVCNSSFVPGLPHEHKEKS